MHHQAEVEKNLAERQAEAKLEADKIIQDVVTKRNTEIDHPLIVDLTRFNLSEDEVKKKMVELQGKKFSAFKINFDNIYSDMISDFVKFVAGIRVKSLTIDNVYATPNSRRGGRTGKIINNLAPILANHPTITELSLVSIGFSSCHELAMVFNKNSQISSFSMISQNTVGALRALADVLATHKSLTSLSLGYDDTTQLEYLAKKIDSNVNLRYITLTQTVEFKTNKKRSHAKVVERKIRDIAKRNLILARTTAAIPIIAKLGFTDRVGADLCKHIFSFLLSPNELLAQRKISEIWQIPTIVNRQISEIVNASATSKKLYARQVMLTKVKESKYTPVSIPTLNAWLYVLKLAYPQALSRIQLNIQAMLKAKREMPADMSDDESQNKATQNNLIRRFEESMTLPTRAEGDCAFHALLGQWNEVSELIETHNITDKRSQIAEAILKVKEDSPMFPLIVDAIQDMLMSEGTSFKALRAAYQKNLLDNQKSIAEAWNKLEFSLKSNKEIAEYIAENVKNKNYLINFNQQFQHCLNLEGGTLFGLILSVQHLDNLLNEYKLKVNATFNLHENILKNPTVLKEYADHLQKPGQYLLPCELNMLAIIFNIKVDYRTYNRNLKNYTNSEILNPNGFISVGVCFNGFGHFERINLYRLNNQNKRVPIGKTPKRSNKVGKLPYINGSGSVKRLKTNAEQGVSSHLASTESVAISEISSSATAANASAAVCKPVVLFHKISPTSPSLPKVALGGANSVVKQCQTFEICSNIMLAPSSVKGYKL